jgi:predicted RNase H-like HicB family nuclease
MVKNVIFRVEIFKENDQFIALCPELNVSSIDDTVEGVKRSIHEAVELFLEECKEAGTLGEVLEESGFQRGFKPQEGWISREPIVIEKVSVETR